MKNQQLIKFQQRLLSLYFKVLQILQKTSNLQQNNMLISSIDHEKKKDFIRVEIKVETIISLFITRQICIEDLHSLDINAKQVLHKICLKSCLSQTQDQTKKVMSLFSLYNDSLKLGKTL